MRIRKSIIVILLLCLMPLTMTFAQRGPGQITIGGFAGMGRITNPELLKEWTKSGIGFGGELRYFISSSTALNLSFTTLPVKADEKNMASNFLSLAGDFLGDLTGIAIDVDVSGFGIDTYMICANLNQYLTSPESSFGFYASIGGGYYMAKIDAATIGVTIDGIAAEEVEIEEDSEDKFGINGGVGLEFKMGEKMALLVEGKYHYVFTDEMEDAEDLGYDTAGKLSFITIVGGIRIAL